ncbi:hypothetical protein PVBG_06057 [Plasmodium vivax Brazil I]|uniref:Uncharacterized protein n=1 Tax=Plasmodium vivax (strain Brazil I) TaxID=1033975 RepID=A0A0J9VB03_PLAV1|nr:hypothetical protein PVBG_06057 [Plasmodium vivax Brazil I]
MNNYCVHKINHIYNVILHKMIKLHSLYDNYETFNSTMKSSDNSTANMAFSHNNKLNYLKIYSSLYINKENAFVNLPHKLKSIYDEWKTENLDANREQCEIFKESITTIGYYEDKDFKDACSRVMYYITKLKERYPGYLISGCKYLYQWVTKECLYNEKYTVHNLLFYKELLNQFCEYQGLDDQYEKEIKKISDEIYQKYKFLDDLYSNLIELQQASGDGCAEAKRFFHLYNQHINKCIANVNNDFCKEFELFRNDYESIMISKDCHDVPKTLTSIYGNNTVTKIIIPFSIISLLALGLFITYKVKK